MAHMNLDNLGEFGKLLKKTLERPYRGAVEVEDDDSVDHEKGLINMAKNKVGGNKDWALFKIRKKGKKPNKREMKEKMEKKIKEKMEEGIKEEETEGDLEESEYFKDMIKKEKTAKKLRKATSRRHKGMIKRAERAKRTKKKGGKKRKRTKKKRKKRR